MRKSKILIFVIISIVLFAASYGVITLRKEISSVQKQLEIIQERLLTQHKQDVPFTQDYVVIYLIKSTPTNFYLVPVNRKIGDLVNPTVALQALLNGPLSHEDLYESIPTTTRLIGLNVHQGLATANFSKEIVDDFNGGSLVEAYLIKAIVNTLTEFPYIEQVQILVEGEAIDSLGGHIIISGHLQREE